MNNEKEFKTVNDYLDLWEKYHKEGDKEKAKEYLNKARALNNKIWEDSKKEIIRVMQEAGLPTEDLIKELNEIK